MITTDRAHSIRFGIIDARSGGTVPLFERFQGGYFGRGSWKLGERRAYLVAFRRSRRAYLRQRKQRAL